MFTSTTQRSAPVITTDDKSAVAEPTERNDMSAVAEPRVKMYRLSHGNVKNRVWHYYQDCSHIKGKS